MNRSPADVSPNPPPGALRMREPLLPPPGMDGVDVARLSWTALQAVLREPGWRAAAAALATELASQLGCRRVAVGWSRQQAVTVIALSHGAQVSEHPSLGGLPEAMLEAITQARTLCVPRVADGSVSITLAHRSWMKREGLSAVISVPLAEAGTGAVLGALSCERESGRFLPDEVIALEQVAAAVAPLLRMKQEAEWGVVQRWRRDWARWRQAEGAMGRRLWRGAGLGAAGLLLAACVIPMPHRLDASARVEGAQQRVLSAPQDGYLRQLHVRPGDVVKKGQVLAQMSDEDLRQQERSRQADLVQHENAFIDAFTRGERAQAALAQARAAEARAQLALVTQQLARTRITAPFDGVVIAGDLSQRLGAPLQRSEALFTLSPMSGWRVVLEVDERQIAQVAAGQGASLLLTALPQHPVDLRVVRVTPVARTVEGRQRYEVLADPLSPPPGWRPGMQGVAKIDLPAEPLGWRWAREGWRKLRWATWTWF